MKILQHRFTDEKKFLSALHDSQIPLEHPQILVQIFSGTQDIAYLQELLQIIRKNLPYAFITGATSDGEILNDQALAHSVIISVLCFEKSTIRIKKIENSTEDFFTQGTSLGKELKKKNLKLAILYGEAFSINGEELLTGFAKEVGDIAIAGALAGDNFRFSQTHLFYQDKILNRGAVAVGIYSDILRAETRFAFDCDIRGKEFTITEAQGNVVSKINQSTPEALYRNYFGSFESADNQFIQAGVQFPLVTNRSGKILARTIKRRLSDGSLCFAGNLKEGEKVRFGIANQLKMLKNAIKIYNEIESRWEAIYIFSCAVRKKLLEPKPSLDIQDFKNIAPVSGFFTYGEMVKEKGKEPLFCNMTMVLLLLSESPDQPITKPVARVEENFSTVDRLLNFTNILLQENEEKNKELNELIQSQLYSLQQKNKLMEKMIYEDSCTGLKNRNKLLREVKEKQPRGVMLLAIKNFRTINDLYGEAVGNLVLKYFADFLKNFALPENIYRLSGKTFAILNVQNKAPEGCMALASTIIRKIEERNFIFEKGDMTFECAISLAIGISNEEGGKYLLEYADMALSYGKQNNQTITLYDEKLQIKQEYEQGISAIKKVKKALDEDKVVPFFQPIFKNKDVSYYEALIRIYEEDGNVLSPFHFLEATKPTTYYSYLTRRMIKKSFEIFQHLNLPVSINLSYLDIANTNTITYFFDMIRKYKMENKLVVELIESDFFRDYELTLAMITTLRSLGVKIAVDDFGSGFSNFQHLTTIAPDYIKIDGSLVKDLDTNPKSQAICKAIISFSKDMGIETIAEFIHSAEIYEVSKLLGVDKHQGFYLGTPQPAEKLFDASLFGDNNNE